MSIRIETERLLIRGFEPEDWRAVHEYMSAPGVRDFVPEWPETAEQAQEFVRQNLGDDARQHALVLRADSNLIGHLGFHPWFGVRTYEIGWAIAPDHQGRGYATEAAHALLAYGFETLSLHRIIATCQPENFASVRTMEKLGMRREGHFRKGVACPDGTWWDEYFYALLEDDWEARRGR